MRVAAITEADLVRMREQLLFDGPNVARKLSRFWALLLLAGVIASAGIVADSTATVIGAMIVAPLMTPILGTVLSVVTGDRANLLRCLGLVVAGAVAVVAIGWLFGKISPVAVDAATNSQVAGRVHPRLIDLISALATGAVGSFALVRADVSDTLPGVAIAISLVPPLGVVGLTLEAGEGRQSLGALLLFLTNVGAILLSGLVVMALYRVQAMAIAHGRGRLARERLVVAGIVAFVIVLSAPLTLSTVNVATQELHRSDVAPVAGRWAGAAGWRVSAVDSTASGIEVRAAGAPPGPRPEQLRRDLDAAGLADLDVTVELTPTERVELRGK